MRINKYIASTGLCSRRKAEEYIQQGLVKINGQIAQLASNVFEGDQVTLNGETIQPQQKEVVLLFNKPIGVTCTTEQQIEGNIIDYIHYPERIFPIGRLDKDSQGLILLTNNGDLVNQCLRVENNHEKEYLVKVNKVLNDEFIRQMSSGVKIYNPVKNCYVTTLPCTITPVDAHSFQIILKQGYNRQIRRMCTALNYRVVSLKRIRFMHLKLNVGVGKYRLLSEEEIAELKEEALKKD